jgi:hypothetical protein
MVVFWRKTEAPARGCWLASSTMPFTVICAAIKRGNNIKEQATVSFFI